MLATTFEDVIIAAPLGFMIGLIVGIFLANRYIIIRPRDKYEVVERNRDYHDRGDRHG